MPLVTTVVSPIGHQLLEMTVAGVAFSSDYFQDPQTQNASVTAPMPRSNDSRIFISSAWSRRNVSNQNDEIRHHRSINFLISKP
jgi:hypothetical protein